jgi:hypothetical protein
MRRRQPRSANAADHEPPAGIDARAPGAPSHTKIATDSSREEISPKSALHCAKPIRKGGQSAARRACRADGFYYPKLLLPPPPPAEAASRPKRCCSSCRACTRTQLVSCAVRRRRRMSRDRIPNPRRPATKAPTACSLRRPRRSRPHVQRRVACSQNMRSSLADCSRPFAKPKSAAARYFR